MNINFNQASTANWSLIPRKVKFDWKTSALHWIPQDPFASHAVNHFSFTLVRGEYFFCRMFNKALPYIHDEKLYQDVKTFIQQEASHSHAHKVSIEEYLQNYGIKVEDQYQRVVYLFDQLLADKPMGIKLPKFLDKLWLDARVGLVAAAEHFTAGLGQYTLERSRWGERGCDSVVSDLFLWHGAEEVEHRTVAYDLYQHINGSYALRAGVMMITAPVFVYLMAIGTAQLAKTDSSIPKSKTNILKWEFWKAWHHSDQNGYMPGPVWFLKTSLRFFKPNYHPYYEASTELAQDYLNQSPAVLAAQIH